MTKSDRDHDQGSSAKGSRSGSRQSEKRHVRAEENLWESARDGDLDSVKELVERYARLAIFMANAHQGRGLDFEYLLAQAKHALGHSVKNYDPQRSDDFSKYAMTVIRNRLLSLLRENSELTQHEIQQNAKFEDAKAKRWHQLEREPTDEEVYQTLGWSAAKRNHHQTAKRKTNRERIDANRERHDYDLSRRAKVPAEEVNSHRTSEIVHAEIEDLDDESREVILQRFFYPDSPTRAEIASRMGIKESRVRSVQEQALKTLRIRLQGTEAAP